MEVPPGLLARTTEASSTMTESNFFPPRFNVSRFSNHDGDSGQNVAFSIKKPNSHSFKLVRDYYKSLYKANLGPVYMEVGDPR